MSTMESKDDNQGRPNEDKGMLYMLLDAQRSGDLESALNVIRELSLSSKASTVLARRLRRWEHLFSWGLGKYAKLDEDRLKDIFSAHCKDDKVWGPFTDLIDSNIEEHLQGGNCSSVSRDSLKEMVRAFISEKYGTDADALSDDHDMPALIRDVIFVGERLLSDFKGNQVQCWRFTLGLFDKVRAPFADLKLLFDGLIEADFPTVARAMWNRPPAEITARWAETLFTKLAENGRAENLRARVRLACWDICFSLGLAGVSILSMTFLRLGIHSIHNATGERETDLNEIQGRDIQSLLGRALHDITVDQLLSACIETSNVAGSKSRFQTLALAHSNRFKRTRPTTKALKTRKQSVNRGIAIPGQQGQAKSKRPVVPKLILGPGGAKKSRSRAELSTRITDNTQSARKPISVAHGRFKLYPARKTIPQESATARSSAHEDYAREWCDLRRAPKAFKSIDQPHNWLQAWDDSSQAYYYLYVDRVTWQWHPPANGYIAASGALRLGRGDGSFETAR